MKPFIKTFRCGDVLSSIWINTKEEYIDANWISNTKDSKSASGYVFTLRSAIVSQKSLKQIVITKVALEYEFITLDSVAKKLNVLPIGAYWCYVIIFMYGMILLNMICIEGMRNYVKIKII